MSHVLLGSVVVILIQSVPRGTDGELCCRDGELYTWELCQRYNLQTMMIRVTYRVGLDQPLQTSWPLSSNPPSSLAFLHVGDRISGSKLLMFKNHQNSHVSRPFPGCHRLRNLEELELPVVSGWWITSGLTIELPVFELLLKIVVVQQSVDSAKWITSLSHLDP